MSDEHEDNVRFFDEVEQWIGRTITVIRSDKYKTVNEVFESVGYMSGPKGARCTTEMKKVPREAFQQFGDVHIFGYTSDEQSRADDFEDRNPTIHVEWILIDRGIMKDTCLAILQEQRIDLPAMYDLGFDHNNCKGCVKSSSPGYWNRTRRLFPDVFERRAKQSRIIGTRLVKLRGKRIFLDELPPDADAPDDNIDCGPVCQIPRSACQECGEEGDPGPCAICGAMIAP